MFETYRMLGREREKELESEAVRLRPLAGRPINRISVVIVAVIVAAFAFGATMARAEVWPEGRSGAQLTAQPSSPDLIERWVAGHKAHVLAPDDRIRVRPTEASNQVSSGPLDPPIATAIRNHRSTSTVGPTAYGPLDPPIAAAVRSHRSTSAVGPTAYGPLDPPIAAAIRNHRSTSTVGPTATTRVKPSGLDWGDFAIGAGAMLGLLLSLGSVRWVAVTVHSRRALQA
jgi:hypothetical protein